MTIELKMLLASIALGLFNLFLAVALATSKRGIAWNSGNREDEVSPLKGVAGRVSLAFENFKETFPFFLAAIFLAQSLGSLGTLSAIGSQLYFFARLVYLPVYAAGIPHLRTLVWLVSILGITLVAISAL